MGLVKRQRVLYNIGYFRNKEKYKASAKTGQKQWISENQEETFMKRETVIVLDFGGQYNQLIARRVRECNVYCEIYSYKTDLEKIKAMEPKGIIFTGGPNSVYLEDSPSYAKEIYDLGIPVLGICYGSQPFSLFCSGTSFSPTAYWFLPAILARYRARSACSRSCS